MPPVLIVDRRNDLMFTKRNSFIARCFGKTRRWSAPTKKSVELVDEERMD
jgi:hypothetical protein